jgi:fatty-acyl-CoA synthase
LLETHDAFSSSTAVMAILNQVPGGALWDTHPYRVGEQPGETADRLGIRCRHVHVKDGRRTNGDEWALTLLGEGDAGSRYSLHAAISTLRGWLSVEWEKKWHPEIAEPEIAIPQHAQALRQYLAMVS